MCLSSPARKPYREIKTCPAIQPRRAGRRDYDQRPGTERKARNKDIEIEKDKSAVSFSFFIYVIFYPQILMTLKSVFPSIHKNDLQAWPAG